MRMFFEIIGTIIATILFAFILLPGTRYFRTRGRYMEELKEPFPPLDN